MSFSLVFESSDIFIEFANALPKPPRLSSADDDFGLKRLGIASFGEGLVGFPNKSVGGLIIFIPSNSELAGLSFGIDGYYDLGKILAILLPNPNPYPNPNPDTAVFFLSAFWTVVPPPNIDLSPNVIVDKVESLLPNTPDEPEPPNGKVFIPPKIPPPPANIGLVESPKTKVGSLEPYFLSSFVVFWASVGLNIDRPLNASDVESKLGPVIYIGFVNNEFPLFGDSFF